MPSEIRKRARGRLPVKSSKGQSRRNRRVVGLLDDEPSGFAGGPLDGGSNGAGDGSVRRP